MTDRDGKVQSVNIKTKNGVTNRPAMKLYPFEVTNKSNRELIYKEKPVPDSCDSSTTNRPRCDAAQRARLQIAEWVESIHAPPPPPEDVKHC